MSHNRKPRVFISRTTVGLKGLADEIADILRDRGAAPIVQSDFLPDWRSVPQMLQEKLIGSDCVIALIGPAHGGEPEFAPANLKDERTHGRRFSFSQWEFLVARDLRRPVFTFLVSGPDVVAPFDSEDIVLKERQQRFIEEFAKDRSTLFFEYSERPQLLEHISELDLPLTVVAGIPTNIPYASLGTLFKGRDEFLAELNGHLTSDVATVIKGHRTIHGMGGVGKTRAAIEYAWKYASDYNALLFVAADSPTDLRRNIAALCGPLVLNLPEQIENDINVQFEAAFRWLALHPGWLLIIDNVDTDDAVIETRTLLERLTQGHVIITSRISDWAGHVKSLDLDVLSEVASIEFLNERTEERRIKQLEDPQYAQQLVQLLDCLALGLEQAGAQISNQRISYAEYIEIWESSRPVALSWHDEETMTYPRSLAITYETSVSQLSPDARELFRTLAWFSPDPIPRQLLGSSGRPKDERRLFGEIERLHLARILTDGRSFNLHRLIQEITRQKQKGSRPPALIIAIEWLDNEMPVESDDMFRWPIVTSLTPHAVFAGAKGAESEILKPTARLLNQASLTLLAKAEYAAAEPIIRMSIALFEKLYGAEAPQIATALCNLGYLLKSTNRLSEAEPLLRRALAIEERPLDTNHRGLVLVLNNLAQLLKETNRLPEAEQHWKRALEICEKFEVPRHQHSIILNNVGQFLQALGRFEDAELQIRRALSIDEQFHGPDHPAVARDLSTLSELLRHANRVTEAEPLVRRALAINEDVYGIAHPAVASSLTNLALILQATNRFQEAEPLMRRALDINQEKYGDEHPNVARDLTNLGMLKKELNCVAEAEPLIRKALSIDEASFGPDHPEVAVDLNNLSLLMQDIGKMTEAESLNRRALSISEKTKGSKHPDTALKLTNLATVLHETNRPKQAEPLLRRAIRIYETSLGTNHPKLVPALTNLSLALQATDRLSEAEQLLLRALSIGEQSFGKDHPSVATLLNNIALLLSERDLFSEAEPFMRRALQIMESSYGSDHASTVMVRENYQSLLKEIEENATHPYVEHGLLKQYQQWAIQSEDYELAKEYQDKIAALRQHNDIDSCDRMRRVYFDRLLKLTCVSVPVKRAIGSAIADDMEALAAIAEMTRGISLIEQFIAELDDFVFQTVCNDLCNVTGRLELFSKLELMQSALKYNKSISPNAWLAYAFNDCRDSKVFYCIANRWAQLPPTRDEAFQVADLLEHFGYPGKASGLRGNV